MLLCEVSFATKHEYRSLQDFIDNYVLREYSVGNEFFEGT